MQISLRKVLAIFGAIFLIILSVSTMWIAKNYGDWARGNSMRSFSVSGEGKVTIVPDIGAFTFSVISEGSKDLAKLQKDNTDKTNKAIDYLKKNGVDKKDIKTENYVVEPQSEYFPCNGNVCPPPKISGYTIRQSASVKIRDLGKSGDILTGVVANGANEVSGLTFTVDDPVKLQNEARALAIVQAKEKAESTAKAGGFSLGRLISLYEDNYTQPDYAVGDGRGGGGVAGKATPAPATSIEPGSTEINISVNLTYEIK